MKVVNLDNIQIYKFYLWEILYQYQFREEDKKYYISSLLELDTKKDNTEKLLKIFKNILEKQNLSVKLLKNDIKWLFNFFNSLLF